MKISAHLPADMAKTGAAAKALEEMGYDAASTAETKHDPFLPCAIAAEHTQRIEIATGIAVAFARNPMTLANLGHDLNAFSKGRFNLGLGTQIAAHITKRFSMPWSDPAPRMREMIAALHAIWDCWYEGKKLDFHGQYYTHALMTPYFIPDECQYGRPKVMLAAVGPLMTKVAAEVADGMLCHGFTTPRYLAEVTVPAIEQTLQAKGRDRSKFEIVATLFTVAGDADEEIEKGLETLRQQVSFYGSTPAYRGVLELHGWGDLQPELNRLSKAGKWDEMAGLITPEMCETFALIGTPEQIVEKQKTLFAGRIDRTSLNVSVSDPDRMKALIKALKAV
ncbi:MAG: TIGR03617 family F420-dependent LLM class oxidoreductase [Caulobacteraceae bacterium]|nr:TIGR03617 family F420-dependent LLM class oxidoreductase [Caulobacteraceae bacterium]